MIYFFTNVTAYTFNNHRFNLNRCMTYSTSFSDKNKCTFLEIRRIRTNYLVTFSIPDNNGTFSRHVVFSCSAGVIGVKKQQRRKSHVLFDMGKKFGSFYYKFYFKSLARFYDLSVPKMCILLKCKFNLFRKFFKSFIYTVKGYSFRYSRLFRKLIKNRSVSASNVNPVMSYLCDKYSNFSRSPFIDFDFSNLYEEQKIINDEKDRLMCEYIDSFNLKNSSCYDIKFVKSAWALHVSKSIMLNNKRHINVHSYVNNKRHINVHSYVNNKRHINVHSYVNKKGHLFIHSVIRGWFHTINNRMNILTEQLGSESNIYLNTLKYVHKIRRRLGIDIFTLFKYMDNIKKSNNILYTPTILSKVALKNKRFFLRMRKRKRLISERRSFKIFCDEYGISDKLFVNQPKSNLSFFRKRKLLEIKRFRRKGFLRTLNFMKNVLFIHVLNGVQLSNLDRNKHALNVLFSTISGLKLRFFKVLKNLSFLLKMCYIHNINSSSNFDFDKLNHLILRSKKLGLFLSLQKQRCKRLNALRCISVEKIYNRLLEINGKKLNKVLTLIGDSDVKLVRYLVRLHDKKLLRSIDDPAISEKRRLKYLNRIRRSTDYVFHYLNGINDKTRMVLIRCLWNLKLARRFNVSTYNNLLHKRLNSPLTLWLKKSILNKYNQITTLNKISYPKKASAYLTHWWKYEHKMNLDPVWEKKKLQIYKELLQRYVNKYKFPRVLTNQIKYKLKSVSLITYFRNITVSLSFNKWFFSIIKHFVTNTLFTSTLSDFSKNIVSVYGKTLFFYNNFVKSYDISNNFDKMVMLVFIWRLLLDICTSFLDKVVEFNEKCEQWYFLLYKNIKTSSSKLYLYKLSNTSYDDDDYYFKRMLRHKLLLLKNSHIKRYKRYKRNIKKRINYHNKFKLRRRLNKKSYESHKFSVFYFLFFIRMIKTSNHSMIRSINFNVKTFINNEFFNYDKVDMYSNYYVFKLFFFKQQLGVKFLCDFQLNRLHFNNKITFYNVFQNKIKVSYLKKNHRFNYFNIKRYFSNTSVVTNNLIKLYLLNFIIYLFITVTDTMLFSFIYSITRFGFLFGYSYRISTSHYCALRSCLSYIYVNNIFEHFTFFFSFIWFGISFFLNISCYECTSLLKNIFSVQVLTSMKSLIKVDYIFSMFNTIMCSNFRYSKNITRAAIISFSMDLFDKINNNHEHLSKRIVNSWDSYLTHFISFLRGVSLNSFKLCNLVTKIYRRPRKPYNGCRQRAKKKNRRYNR